MGWLGVSGIMLLVALVPLMIISEHYGSSRRDWWRMCGWAALTFLLWNMATIWWVWIATPAGPIAAGIVGTFWNLVAFMGYHYVSKRAPRALAYTLLVTLWIATEYAYNSADVMTFPWLLLGNGFSNDIWAVQWYEYTGIFGGTLWVMLSNVAIFELLRTRTKRAKVRAALISLLPILLSVGIYFSYTPSSKSTTIAVVQPNVACYEPEKISSAELNELVAQVPEGASFILLPESAMSYVRDNVVSSFDQESMSLYTPLFENIMQGRSDGAKLISGASTVKYYGKKQGSATARHNDIYGYYDLFNSALLVSSEGVVEQIYDKGKLVIGVEAIPDFVDAVIDLGGIAGQLGWGKQHLVFENNGVKIGPSICYEGLYGDYFAGFVREGAEVMALISNDGWWGDTPGHRRLFDFSKLRAIECRRAIARSANTGISGFISARGDVVGPTLEWDEQGVLATELELRNDVTLYVRYGDIVARWAVYIAVLSVLYYISYRARRRNHIVE